MYEGPRDTDLSCYPVETFFKKLCVFLERSRGIAVRTFSMASILRVLFQIRREFVRLITLIGLNKLLTNIIFPKHLKNFHARVFDGLLSETRKGLFITSYLRKSVWCEKNILWNLEMTEYFTHQHVWKVVKIHWTHILEATTCFFTCRKTCVFPPKKSFDFRTKKMN